MTKLSGRWANTTPEERSKHMSTLKKHYWSSVPPDKRRRLALKLVRARKKNINN